MLAAPRSRQFDDPVLRRLIDAYLPGAGSTGAEERARVFRLAWDFIGSELGSRNEQYERFYLASGATNLRRAHTIGDTARSDALVDRFLAEART
jgi:aromatic ring hydroxylase